MGDLHRGEGKGRGGGSSPASGLDPPSQPKGHAPETGRSAPALDDASELAIRRPGPSQASGSAELRVVPTRGAGDEERQRLATFTVTDRVVGETWISFGSIALTLLGPRSSASGRRGMIYF
jgi:hypothetical protein